MPFIHERDRFSGSLVGQCLGDAIGFCVEGRSEVECAAYVAQISARDPDHRLVACQGFPLGQYTDDSQLSRELMASYSACGRFDPADYADRIRSIFVDNRIVGRGLATHAAARRLIEGASWEQAGAAAGNAGNGTAMRAGPVGLLFGDDPERMIQVAHDQGRITHLDPRCSAGSVAIAGAVALAARPGEIDRIKFICQVGEWTATFDADFAGEILRLAEWLDLAPNEAAPIISRSGSPDYVDGWRWISPFVIPSVLWSLYSFLRTPTDYWTTIYTSIAAGGDVDTTAAMAGAISGAHIGLQALPVSLARRVNDQGTRGFDELVALSHRCFAVKTGQIQI